MEPLFDPKWKHLSNDIIADSPLAVIGLDNERVVRLWNSAASQLFGWTASEVLGGPYPLIPAEEQASFSPIWDRISRGERILAFETLRQARSGEVIPISLTTHPVHERGKVIGSIGFLVDLRERRKLEAKFLHAQKMESVGRLAAGVAHEFNNVLTAILGYCRLLEDRFAVGDPRLDEVREIGMAGRRAAALTRQLLALSCRQVVSPRPLSLNVSAESLRTMLERVLGEDIELLFDLDPALPGVMADPTQIEQVLLNLAVNARDAMPRGGRLQIGTSSLRLAKGLEVRETRLPPGAYAMLSVRDTGVGMEPSVRERLFEPFFTTKDPGVGTGLGLATVEVIVRLAGGGVVVLSSPGKGTEIQMVLPALEGRPAPPPPAVSKAPPHGAGERVLLAEDDPDVRRFLERVLTEGGYEVISARDGAEGVQHLAQECFALVVSDIVMPKVDGPALAVHALRRKVPVVLISGYTEAADAAAIPPGVPVLSKPVEAAVLLHEIRRLLDKPARKPKARRAPARAA